MSEAHTPSARLNADGTDQDDWDSHWDAFGEVSMRNPANAYRHAMILRLLGDVPPGAVLLDIGSGQGQFIQPRGVSVDGVGNVYVCEFGSSRIQRFGRDYVAAL